MKKEFEEKILKEISQKFNLQKRQKINYEKFIAMYNNYREYFNELEFANLLGINNRSYKKITQNHKSEVFILMNQNLTEEEKKEKLLELVQLYNLYKGQKIDYNLFKKIYEQVKTILTEVEFASLLGINAGNLRNIRNTKDKARLFTNIKLKNETIEKIRKSIVVKYEGKSIYYIQNINDKGKVDFLELYKPYRLYFNENEFARLLGISDKNLWYTKNNQANPIIKDTEKVKKVEELKKGIIEGRYYSKDEIEKICQKFNILVDDFINYYINKGKFFDSTEYKKALNNNNGLWIGTSKIEKSYIEKYNEMYNRIVKTIINGINQKYRAYYLEEDIKQDMLVYMINNCGDIILNFEFDEKLMERMLWLRTRQYGQIKYIAELKKDIKKVKLNENKIGVKDNLEEYEQISIYKEEIDEEKLISLLKNYLEQGYDREAIIENISNTFHIEKMDMLEMMKKYLLEKGKVVKNKNGEYEIGE